MSPAVIGTAIVVLIVAAVLGWHGQKSYAAHGDVKVAKNRLRGGRKTRLRSVHVCEGDGGHRAGHGLKRKGCMS